MAHLTPVATALITTLAMAQSGTGVRPSVQEPNPIGRWRVEYRFSEGPASVLQFDARESGQGSFLPIDTRRSSLAPAVPGKARWTHTSTRVSFSGEVEIPIGNVGSYMRQLAFDGAFASANVIVGDVREVGDVASGSSVPASKGTFAATRMRASKEPAAPPNERE
jgi:hypothetical protein